MLVDEILQSVRQAVDEALTSDRYRVYQGQSCDQLESLLCQRFSASQTLLTSSGSAGLELALRAAGVGPGDEVLLSAYDYPGNFWAIERTGARPVLLDVEEQGWRIDQEALLSGDGNDASRTIKALVVSHLHGQLQPVSQLRSWCDQRGIVMIEDACQAVGATIAGQSVASFGHASIVSFGGGKVLSCGRGGAVLTSDPQLAQRARIAAGAGSGPYTMSELQAAVVVAQLAWLDRINAECRDYFTQVALAVEASAGMSNGESASDVVCPYTSIDNEPEQKAFYQAGFLLRRDRDGQLAQAVGELSAAGVAAGVGFAGFHRRSTRRCRAWTPLLHTAVAAANTLTIHHRQALNLRFTPLQLSELIYKASAREA